VASTAEVPCYAPNGARNFATRGDSFGGSCFSPCFSTSSMGNRATLPNNCPSDVSPVCSDSNLGACENVVLCTATPSGWWYNLDRSSSTATNKQGLCLRTTDEPCSSWRIQNNGAGVTQVQNTGFCSNLRTCAACVAALGLSLRSTSGTLSCVSSQSSCTTDTVFRSGFDFACSTSGLCLRSSCDSGGSCVAPTQAPLPTAAPLVMPALNACRNCRGFWYSSLQFPFFDGNSNTGICTDSFNNIPNCMHYVSLCSSFTSFSPVTSATSCSFSGTSSVPAGFIAVVVIVPLIWLINMIAIGIFAHRRGFNVVVYVTAAFFVSVFAWICIAFENNSTDVVVSDGVPLQSMQPNTNYPSDQKYANYAPNPNMPSPYDPSAQGSHNPYNPGPPQAPYGNLPPPYGNAPPPYGNAPPPGANI
jgi:hypothetical protein